MDRITQILIKNLNQRVEALEEKSEDYQEKKPQVPAKQGPEMASNAQISYLRSLGGAVSDGMTMDQAGVEIDKMLAAIAEDNVRNEIPENKKSIQAPEEPVEVATDDAGLDEEGLM